MRRQTLRKPCSSTRHDHRSSTLTNAIQIPKKTLIPYAAPPAAAFLSLLMILTTQLQKGLSKAALREPKRSSSIQCHEERERASDRATEASSLCERAREGGARKQEARAAICCLRSLVTDTGVRQGVGHERARKWGSDKTNRGTICSQVGVPKWVNNRPPKIGHANRYWFISNWK
jgi:hypothetical protein